jgi:hypothetical protein
VSTSLFLGFVNGSKVVVEVRRRVYKKSVVVLLEIMSGDIWLDEFTKYFGSNVYI